MTKHQKAVTGAIALAVLSLGAVAVAQMFDLPEFVTVEQEIPVQTPEEGQQVAVLEIDLESKDDGSAIAQLKSLRVIDSFAPKSIARTGGEWEVRIDGERELTFQIPNPLIAEVENPDDPETPFETVTLDSYEWTLVVPLYDERGPLGAETIEVVDSSTGATILQTPLS